MNLQSHQELEGSAGPRSLAQLFSDIVSGVQQMVRSELKLAKIELTRSVREARSSAILLASGGIFSLFAIGFLCLTAMFALELVLPNWLAALITGLVLLIVGGAALATGSSRLKRIRPPRDTIQTTKEDLQWIKEQSRS